MSNYSETFTCSCEWCTQSPKVIGYGHGVQQDAPLRLDSAGHMRQLLLEAEKKLDDANEFEEEVRRRSAVMVSPDPDLDVSMVEDIPTHNVVEDVSGIPMAQPSSGPNAIPFEFKEWQKKAIAAELEKFVNEARGVLKRKTKDNCPVSECPVQIALEKKNVLQHLIRYHYIEATWLKQYYPKLVVNWQSFESEFAKARSSGISHAYSYYGSRWAEVKWDEIDPNREQVEDLTEESD